MRALLETLREEWVGLERAVTDVTHTIEQLARTDAACRRLVEIPGFGYLTASAMVASIGKGEMFRRGRDFAAWAGLVPRQHSTGGRPTLLGISKRGNNYLRRLLITEHERSTDWPIAPDYHRDGGWTRLISVRPRTSPSSPWPTSWREPPGRCWCAGMRIARSDQRTPRPKNIP